MTRIARLAPRIADLARTPRIEARSLPRRAPARQRRGHAGILHAVTFTPLGPAHLAALVAVPALAWALAAVVRRRPGALRPIRRALAAAIAGTTIAWYAHVVRAGWFDPPHGLPLDLCDVVLWVTVVALAAPRPWALEGAWYFGLGGSGMALLTPDVGGDAPAYAAAQFYVGHGLVVAAVLFLAWAGALRPRPGSWWRAFLAGNAYALAVGAFDVAFGTNYMYLREKPAAGSLLDLLGPWPWYVLAGDAVALAVLWLLHRPFRRAPALPAAEPPAGR
jgi:hypothetical integral membrane protein (TIGR02206 family)